jgi:hypothetical protein
LEAEFTKEFKQVNQNAGIVAITQYLKRELKDNYDERTREKVNLAREKDNLAREKVNLARKEDTRLELLKQQTAALQNSNQNQGNFN